MVSPVKIRKEIYRGMPGIITSSGGKKKKKKELIKIKNCQVRCITRISGGDLG